MDEQRVGGWLRALGMAVALGVAAVAFVIAPVERIADVVMGGMLMAAFSAIAIPTRSGVRLSPALSVIAALPLLRFRDTDVRLLLETQLAVVLLGAALAWIASSGRGLTPRAATTHAVRLMVAGVAYVTLFEAVGVRGLAEVSIETDEWLSDWWQVLTIGLVTPVVFVLEGTAATVTRSAISRSLRSRGPLELRDFDIYLTLVAAGALFGLTFAVIGWFALIVAGLPFLLALGSFRRLAETRRTYLQTVRALGQIPEAAGHVEPGHAVRVARLATAIARYLGLAPTAVEKVLWAAYLHDIGRISLNDPGVAKIGYTEADIAEWGSIIVEEATLDDIAEIIKLQHEPYRRPGQQADPDLPLASRIIKVASAYDDLVSDGSHSPLEALEQLHRGSVYDYDPDIVNAVRSILEAREALGGTEVPAGRHG